MTNRARWPDFRGKPAKYRNVPTETPDGIKFASKAEARWYLKLRTDEVLGVVSYFLRQVPIHLPGGIRYVVDFQVFYTDGTVRYLDVKGMETSTFKLKKTQVEALYPITIETVK